MTCPLCSSSNTKPYIKLSSHTLIFVCGNCQNAFTVPPPVDIDYHQAEFSPQAVISHIDDLPPDWRASCHLQLKLITQFLKPSAKILEIGCGNGIFLSALQQIGYKTTGIEPSRTASILARNRGLNIISGAFPSRRLRFAYDLVIATQVLEHIRDTGFFLTAIHRQISPHGLLMLTQTNFQGLVPRLDPHGWYAWVPEQHFYHFTPIGLSKLTTAAGYKTVNLSYSTLVHPGWKNFLPRLFPTLGDQFHLLVQKKINANSN